MKRIVQTFVLATIVFASCSFPSRFVLRNNSQSTLVIQFTSTKKMVIRPGDSAKILLSEIITPGLIVTLDDKRRDYRWISPTDGPDRGSQLFRLSLEHDGKIYLLKPGPIWTQLTPMEPQPSGFPITAE